MYKNYKVIFALLLIYKQKLLKLFSIKIKIISMIKDNIVQNVYLDFEYL